jgi:uracil-DNA glycosylase
MFKVNNDWDDILQTASKHLGSDYQMLLEQGEYFPNKDNFLNAFKSLPLQQTKYILFGQDPYPREKSAIGYAFIDGAVSNIWSDSKGLSKEVNRATSLRNFMKMLLVAHGYLGDDTSKGAIETFNKSDFVQTILDLRDNFEKSGVLLLNTALVFQDKEKSKYHVKEWKPFMKSLLGNMPDSVELILFGNMAKELGKYEELSRFKKHYFEHPYNVSFIQNREVHEHFRPMNLLT